MIRVNKKFQILLLFKSGHLFNAPAFIYLFSKFEKATQNHPSTHFLCIGRVIHIVRYYKLVNVA